MRELGGNVVLEESELGGQLHSWLSAQFALCDVALLQCNASMTGWTRICTQLADCILVVVLADQDPSLSEVEVELQEHGSRQELKLLHRLDKPYTRNTSSFLRLRESVSAFHQIRCPPRLFSNIPEADKLSLYQELFQQAPDHLSDVASLARILTGEAIGVVFGGGGARGCVHVGVIKALAEAGVPVDVIGGTGIGSFIGALWAKDSDVAHVTQTSRDWCFGVSGFWWKFFDLTYPIVSLFKGSWLNNLLKVIFDDWRIEDLPKPFFCVTIDLCASAVRVHTFGSVWKYVRASMSLVGLFPPVKDSRDGYLLVAGGYVNNLPADVMNEMGVKTILAIDVSTQDNNLTYTNCGNEISGWWILFRRWCFWKERIVVMTFAEVCLRIVNLLSRRHLERVKMSRVATIIDPPVQASEVQKF